MVKINVSNIVAKWLLERKEVGQSYNDVLLKELDIQIEQKEQVVKQDIKEVKEPAGNILEELENYMITDLNTLKYTPGNEFEIKCKELREAYIENGKGKEAEIVIEEAKRLKAKFKSLKENETKE